MENHKPQTEKDKQAELSAYDVKIYAAQAEMDRAMSFELKALGVPFFGTKQDLIRSETLEDDDALMAKQPKWSPRITASELVQLKRQMVRYLEDMYKD